MGEIDSEYALLKIALEGYREEHSDLNETWRQLDTKAQGTTTIAGVFVAATFVFVRELHSLCPAVWTRVGLAVGLLCLAASVTLALVAMWIRQVSAAPVGEPIEKFAEDLVALDSRERAECMPGFIRDQLGPWKRVNAQVQKKLLSKAGFVAWAQASLLAGIGFLIVVAVLVIGGWS